MNIAINGSFLHPFGNGMLKSTQERMERQQQTENQVAFFEAQKGNLKNMVCESPEEIMKKLDMLHSYEEQIAAVKAAYNNEQIYHMMDEAKEIGEQIAEAVEKSKPKTPEERRKDLVEEAMGIEEQDGVLSEIMDELDEVLEVMEGLEASEEALSGEAAAETLEEGAEVSGNVADTTQESAADIEETEAKTPVLQDEKALEEAKNHIYRRFDIKI